MDPTVKAAVQTLSLINTLDELEDLGLLRKKLKTKAYEFRHQLVKLIDEIQEHSDVSTMDTLIKLSNTFDDKLNEIEESF